MHHTTYYGTKTDYTSPRTEIIVATIVGNRSHLRVVHNVANGPKVDGYLDGNKVLKSVSYKAISDYLEVSSGVHLLTVKVAGTDKAIINGKFDLLPGKSYTLIVHGLIKDLKSIAPLLLDDNLGCPASGKAHVRFIHAAAGTSSVDILVSRNNSNMTRIFTDVSYGHTGSPTYFPVDAGLVEVSVNPYNSKEKLLGPIFLRLVDGGIYTIIASGFYGDLDSPLTALVSEDSKGSCIITQY